MAPYIISTFYKIIDIEDYIDLKVPLLAFMKKNKITGTILITPEGINGTVCMHINNAQLFYNYMKSIHLFEDIEYCQTYAQYSAFQRSKVLLKNELVALRMKGLSLKERGQHLSGNRWENLIEDPGVILVDTRNEFEIAFGSFRGAISPKTNKFSDFSQWANHYFSNVDKATPIAMFCTGGIRCEKSTAYMKYLGFQNVYHLQGGILKYLQDTHNEKKLWHGSCFVFDDRLALDDQLQPIEEEGNL